MRENIAAAMKQALKDKDQAALGTMRLIMAALKDRDIAARGNGNPDGISGDDILGLLQTMIKQRTESAKMYNDGGRPELAAAEEADTDSDLCDDRNRSDSQHSQRCDCNVAVHDVSRFVSNDSA